MNMKHDFDEAIRLYQYWQIELRKQLNREPSIDDLAQAINEAPEIIIELKDYIETMADYSVGLGGVLPEGSNYLTD